MNAPEGRMKRSERLTLGRRGLLRPNGQVPACRLQSERWKVYLINVSLCSHYVNLRTCKLEGHYVKIVYKKKNGRLVKEGRYCATCGLWSIGIPSSKP